MRLSKEDLDKIHYDGYFLVQQVNLSIGSYYAKFCNINSRFMELLGKKVFDLVGIKSADYEYVQEKGCLLSEDLNCDKHMFSCYDLFIMRANTLKQVYDGLDNLTYRLNNGIEYKVDKVKLQIEIMHFIDILFSNVDRHISNFGFYLHDNGEVELVLLDNEYFLQNFKTATRPMSCGDDEIESQDFMAVSKKYEATKFFESMSDEMKALVSKYLELFSPERVELLLNTIEEEQCLGWPLKASSLRQYKKNYKMICKLLNMNNKHVFGRTLKK
jgi:hypothetical protein